MIFHVDELHFFVAVLRSLLTVIVAHSLKVLTNQISDFNNTHFIDFSAILKMKLIE